MRIHGLHRSRMAACPDRCTFLCSRFSVFHNLLKIAAPRTTGNHIPHCVSQCLPRVHIVGNVPFPHASSCACSLNRNGLIVLRAMLDQDDGIRNTRLMQN